jgi:hypothetical protein
MSDGKDVLAWTRTTMGHTCQLKCLRTMRLFLSRSLQRRMAIESRDSGSRRNVEDEA